MPCTQCGTAAWNRFEGLSPDRSLELCSERPEFEGPVPWRRVAAGTYEPETFRGIVTPLGVTRFVKNSIKMTCCEPQQVISDCQSLPFIGKKRGRVEGEKQSGFSPSVRGSAQSEATAEPRTGSSRVCVSTPRDFNKTTCCEPQQVIFSLRKQTRPVFPSWPVPWLWGFGSGDPRPPRG